jgi:hypothetical protein
MIQIITHNGKSVSEGGLRLGYFYSTPSGSEVVPASLVSLFNPTPKPIVKPKLVQARRHPVWMEAECPFCGMIHGQRFDPVPLGVITCHRLWCGKQFEVVA